MSIEHTDRESAAVAKAPRVSLADIESAINMRYDLTGSQALAGHIIHEADVEKLKIFSICILTMKNGFMVIGTSAPASPENYNQELGAKFAYENCVRQLWPLMGFALRDRLHEQGAATSAT